MNLFRIIESVKNTPRLGWVQRGISASDAETIAAHTLESAIVCLDLGEHLLKEDFLSLEEIKNATLIALIHDIPEGVIGDFNRYVSRHIGDMKKKLEDLVMEEIQNDILKDLWKRYSDMRSREALLSKLCDKISTYVQATRYRRLGYRTDDIIDNAKIEIRDLGIKLCKENSRCIDSIERYISTIEAQI
ncbi:MAG: HD domain-containing protein [Sulfolobales archaeon]